MLAAPDIAEGRLGTLPWLGLIVAYSLFRTIRPIADVVERREKLELAAETLVMAGATAATGFWDSPLLFSNLTAVVAAGFACGFGLAVRLAVAASLGIGVPSLARADDVAADARLFAQWGVELVLVALVAGYARLILGDAVARHSVALDRLGRLTDANALLFSLHQVAQDLPSSLDLAEVLDSTLGRLRELLSFDVAVILLREEADGTWSVARGHGLRLPPVIHDDALPPAVLEAAAGVVVHAPDLAPGGERGLDAGSGSGLYAGLRARGALIGVICLEHSAPFHFSDRDAELLAGFAEPAALAVDNARWFSRLRSVGADEERIRIARELHDDMGQSLAYLAFELDRIVRNQGRGDDVEPDLRALRDEVRGIVRGVRDTLYDLRTDVSDERTVPMVLEDFLMRVRQRSGLHVVFRSDETVRMPRPQERELWRIAQEAVVNVERHADATQITVTWHADEYGATVAVADDGHGFAAGSGRLDSYGLIGMRERAAAIGGSLDVDSAPGRGCTVRARVARPGT